MDPDIAAAVAVLLEIARPLGLSPILIGALASEAAPDRPDGAPSPRATLDADFAIQVRDWASYTALMEAIARDHRRDPHIEHRVYIRNIKIDIVPFGRGVAPDGRQLIWPISQFLMDITGFEEAARDAREVELAPGVRLKCISVPAFTLLKVAAYLDRQRKGDPKFKSDAEDLLFWFRYYASGEDDNPRYEVIGQEGASSIDYFKAGAAILGRDVARLASSAARQRVDEFVSHARPEESPFWSGTTRASFTEEDAARALDEGLGLLEAFAWGFSSQEP